MRTPRRARALAHSIASVAAGAGLKTTCLLTDMNQPLAPVSGNALEMRYAIDILTGKRQRCAPSRGLRRACRRNAGARRPSLAATTPSSAQNGRSIQERPRNALRAWSKRSGDLATCSSGAAHAHLRRRQPIIHDVVAERPGTHSQYQRAAHWNGDRRARRRPNPATRRNRLRCGDRRHSSRGRPCGPRDRPLRACMRGERKTPRRRPRWSLPPSASLPRPLPTRRSFWSA